MPAIAPVVMSASMPATMSANSFLEEARSILVSIHLEIAMFLSAMAVYYVLKQRRVSYSQTKKPKVVKLVNDEDGEAETVRSTITRNQTRKSQSELVEGLDISYDAGDYKSVLKYWDASKQSNKAPTSQLSHVVESMKCCKKEDTFIVHELKRHYQKHPQQCNMSSVNEILESSGRRLDSQLIGHIVDMLPSIDLKKDQRTYEILLSTEFTMRNFDKVQALVEEMRESMIPFSERALVICMKVALRIGNLPEALNNLRQLKVAWKAEGKDISLETPSQAPRVLVSQLVDLACKECKLTQIMPDLENLPIAEEVANNMLTECVRLGDSLLARSVEKLVRAQGDVSDVTYSLLVRAFAQDPEHARTIVDEVVALRGKHCSPDLVSTVLAFCAKKQESALPDSMFEQLKPHSSNVVAAFIRYYLEIGNAAKACDIFENNDESLQKGSVFGSRLERSLLSAALSCGRSSIASKLLESSPSDIAKHITMIQKCAAENNLQGSFDMFDSLARSGVDLNSVVYNSVLEACVQCRDFSAAEKWMEKSKQAGMVDVVSYNTLIKAHLLNHKASKARSLIEEMKALGLQPNRITYNELINSVIAGGGNKDSMWSIVQEMNEAGIRPNQVTCSILLKHLNAKSSDAEVSSIMDLMNTMEEQMDEVLLSSVIEACVRVGKPDLLARKLKELQGGNRISINGAHTFGSLIKAYGYASDLDGVWRCWKEMRSRHIKPSSITLGCMIEAIVRNGDSDGAYDLIQQVQEDDQCRGVVNSVIYCSVLKGFAREKKLDRAWTLYKEMCQKNVDISVVAYNTLIDACARVGRMEHVPSLLEDMKRRSVQLNLITYSTMIKGHSQSGDVQGAFALLEKMQQETTFKPDEIMYNSLLDACAQHSLSSEGLRLLEEMQDNGVHPSNFTLSVVVKLMNRSRRVDQAFNLVRDISQKYGFKPNVHVYTNLIQACCSNRQLSRAMDTLETMIREGVNPESRTYAVLTRACMLSNQPDQAVALLRGALGLSGAHPIVARKMCPNVDHTIVNEILNGLVDRGFTQALAVPLLTDIKSGKQRVRIDGATQNRVMSSSMDKDKTWGVNTKSKSRP